MNCSSCKTGLAAATAVALFLGVPLAVRASEGSRYGEEGIRVTGTATVRLKPDLAVLTLGCETPNKRL
jgi:uncharacterized protein YggE